MKKLMVLMMAAFMAVGLVGTAGATDFTWTLSNANTLKFFASPVTESGVSVYLLAGGPTGTDTASANARAGATVQMINPDTGVSSFWLGAAIIAGSSAYGTPGVVSGETLFVQLSNLLGPGAGGALSGTSVVAINGITGGTYYTVSIPHAQGDRGGPIAISSISGGTLYSAPLTIDPAGSTIWGTSGVSTPGNGVSIWAMTMANGAYSSYATGVSTIYAAPLISGSSIYILGSNTQVNTGVSLIAFNTTNGAVAARAQVVLGATGDTPFATPVVAGNSIFVVDAVGGLTAYNKATLVPGAQDNIKFAVQANSAVTASPVTNGAFLAVAVNDKGNNQAGVTVFDLSKPLAGSTGASWWFTWSGATITATPAISNGVLYVAVNDTSDGGLIDRFNLSGHSGKLTAPDYTTITLDSRGRALGFFDFSSPIIKNNRLIIVSNGGTGAAGAAAAGTPVLYNFDVSGSNARGNASWQQFKADAERTGNNTAAAAAVPTAVDDDDSGCFISTIK